VFVPAVDVLSICFNSQTIYEVGGLQEVGLLVANITDTF